MRGETMKDKSKKSTYSTTFGVDPSFGNTLCTKPPSKNIAYLSDIKKELSPASKFFQGIWLGTYIPAGYSLYYEN